MFDLCTTEQLSRTLLACYLCSEGCVTEICQLPREHYNHLVWLLQGNLKLDASVADGNNTPDFISGRLFATLMPWDTQRQQSWLFL